MLPPREIWNHFEDIGFEEGRKLRRMKCIHCARTMVKSTTQGRAHLEAFNCDAHREDNSRSRRKQHHPSPRHNMNGNNILRKNNVIRTSENVMPSQETAPHFSKQGQAAYPPQQSSTIHYPPLPRIINKNSSSSSNNQNYELREKNVALIGKISSSERMQRYFDSQVLYQNEVNNFPQSSSNNNDLMQQDPHGGNQMPMNQLCSWNN